MSSQTAPSTEGRPPSPPAATIDHMIVQGLKCEKYSKPVRGISEDQLNETLTSLTSGMLIRAGFACRCEAHEGIVVSLNGVRGEYQVPARCKNPVDFLEHAALPLAAGNQFYAIVGEQSAGKGSVCERKVRGIGHAQVGRCLEPRALGACLGNHGI